jgi:hypothetical protein
VLTSIEVDCRDSEEHRELLRRFMREFKPEQIKLYLVREVIAGLRNASAIDLTQFGGLNARTELEARKDEDDGYDVLLEQLSNSAPGAHAPPYDVTLCGRWSSQADEAQRAAPARRGNGESARSEGEHTPLASRTFALQVEDGGGTHAVELAGVIPGRRYVVGKDPGCDIVVDGVYASRRHCEIWFDQGRWWVADNDSTNGVRIETADGQRRSVPAPRDDAQPTELALDAWLVLSADARGDAAQYPRLSLRTAAAGSDVRAPATPIAPARREAARRVQGFMIAAHTASGVQEAEVAATALPFGIGRSRNQGLVIDWTHVEVSGRHLEIVAVDETGASVIVHGDNGVSVDGTPYATGAQFRWTPGETLTLGRADGGVPPCTLTLSAGNSRAGA